MHEAVFCDQVDDAVLLGRLHSNGEIIRSLCRETNIDSVFSERWVGCGMIYLNNMRLDCKT